MKIFEKELFIISKLVFDQKYPVFVLDPGGNVGKNFKTDFTYLTRRNQVEQLAAFKKKYYLINASGASTFSFPLNFNYAEAIISLNNSTETSMDFYHKDLYFFRDEYKRISWIVSENHRVADFLHSLDKVKSLVDLNNFLSVFPFTYKYFMLKMGNVGKTADGRIQLLIRKRNLFTTLTDQIIDSYSVDFGQCSEGILKFRFYRGTKVILLIKKAWNTEGQKKLEHEYELIEKLQSNVFQYAVIPKIKKEQQEFLLEFNEPFKQPELYQLNGKYYTPLENSLTEIAEKTKGKTLISRIWRNENLYDNLVFIKSRVDSKMFPRGLSIINFIKIYTEMVKIFDQLEPEDEIYTSLAVRKLKAENLGYNNSKIFFHSLENAEENYPMYYDLFDFIFHTAESKDQPDSDDLIEDIEYLKESLQETGFDDNFEKYLKIFFLIHMIPEMASMLVKQVLPPEENIKLLTWAEIIEYLNNKN